MKSRSKEARDRCMSAEMRLEDLATMPTTARC
jgi:hypothetical protein